MNLYSISTGYFKLDGGAMFGVVPKTMWQKWNPADQNNMCTWAIRSLLIEDGNKLILIDTGIGNKQGDSFLKHFYLHGADSLATSLKKVGFATTDITDVFLTHLHFDHCGGAIERQNEKLIPSFPNATYHINSNQWQWALHPNEREKATYLKENLLPIEASGQLNFINQPQKNTLPFDFVEVNGHTQGLMIPQINYKNNTIVFVSDLIPSTAHIPIPYIMSYDCQPLLTLSEKNTLLTQAVNHNYILFFQHDPLIECATVEQTEKGVRLKESFFLNTLSKY